MPIDIATGNVELAREDFALPGRVPIKWTRHYHSGLSNASTAPLGPGWTTSWLPTLKRVERNWQYFSPAGELNTFPDPDGRIERGQTIRLLGAFLELKRHDNRYTVTQWDVESGEIQRFVFTSERATDAPALAAVENVSGDGVEVAWEASGRLRSLRQKIENRTILISYSPAGRISSLVLMTKGGARKELVRYEYDAVGRLTAAFDCRGLANRYEYDVNSWVTREILKDGAVYLYRYDDRGRCIHFSGLDRYNEKHLRFMDAARTTIVTNSHGKTSVYEHLVSGQIAGEADPSGNQRRTIFDEYNRVVAKVEPDGATTRYTYDEHGNRDGIVDPLGNTHRFVFNAYHQPVSLADPLGNTWLREYNAEHRLAAIRNPLGATWKIDYDETGNPVVITDPLGSSRHQRFAHGLLQEMTDWMGHVSEYKWDEFGRVIERVDSTRKRTVFHYDSVGNPIEVKLPDGCRLRATYDSGDNLSSFTNTNGQTTRLRYGPCHRLLERVDSLGRAVRYVWGTETIQLEAVINEKGETFSYARDDQGRIVQERSFDGREQHFAYDATGRCITVTNGAGEKIQLKRDAAGRLAEKTLPDGALTRYEYDPVGRIIAATNPDIPVRFEYDAAGRLILEAQGEHWVSTHYDAAGEVIRTSTSLGHKVNYDLDPNGRMRRLSIANNQSITFERDSRGLETLRRMPGAIRLEQRYDSMGRLLDQRVGQSFYASTAAFGESQIRAGDEIIKRDFTYNADGLLLSVADARWGATQYAYDPAERLLSALRDRGLSEHFAYDVTDNLTHVQEREDESVDQTCAYGPGNRLLARKDTRYEYDSDGRLLRKTEASKKEGSRIWEYFWDAQGQLRRLRRPDGQEWEYRYDAFGRRVEKRGPTETRRFLWDGDVIIHEITDDGQTLAWIVKHGSFAPLAKMQDATLNPIITDQLGTPREMLDSSGRVVWATSLTAWGRIERQYKTGSEYDCPIRFQGQWFDEESGLHYNRFRYYDPTNGRFINSDPIGIIGGRNLYKYVQNPVIWIDPFGLAAKKCGDAGTEEHYVGTEKALQEGATPDSKYTQVHPDMPDKAIQTTIYDSQGKAIGQVDWKYQHGADPGHGHGLTTPGDFGSGHQGQGTFYPAGQLPPGWGDLPKGVTPIQ